MGITFSSIFNQLFGKKDMRILMVGLDAAGRNNHNNDRFDEEDINVVCDREDNDPIQAEAW